MKGRITTIYIIVFCIYLAAVGFICFMKPSSIPELGMDTFLGIPVDKILHFLMFLPYPVLAGQIFIRRDTGIASCIIIMATLAITGIGTAYGTELIQAQTGYRSYEIGDFHADMAGIAAGCMITIAYLTYTKLKK